MIVPSLLNAIVRLDGEAMVMHVGDKPYVVTPSGQTELAAKGLTFDAVGGMVQRLLPEEWQHALEEFGAVQYEFPPIPEFPGEHFTVVAARGGDDMWLEIRRRRVGDALHVSALGAPAASAQNAGDAHDLAMPDASELWGEDEEAAPVVARVARQADPVAPPAAAEPRVESDPAPAPPVAAEPRVDPEPAPSRPVEVARPVPHPAVVVPMSRSPIRQEPPAALPAQPSGLDRLLRLGAARGASTLYLSSQSRPSVRVDGEIQVLAGEETLGPGDVESLLIDLMPERNREELRSGASTEWICDVAEVGRVRCMTFRDQRGAGGIFRMMPVRAISADQLGLSREMQALAAEVEGLVLVAGPRSSGKSTLISAMVDLINRTRHDHVITIESEVKVVHEQRRSLVSQREVRGSSEEKVAVGRAALREDPDVLVFEELRGADLISLAIEASASGHLVIAGLPAHTATGAIDRIIDAYPPVERRRVQLELAENLRGVVAQVLVRKGGGGRLAAREVLLNTPAVSSAIAEGKTSQLTAAMEGGRKYGMVPLNESLAALVQAGTVEAREAYRQAGDRAGFLALLKRYGVDTTFAERLA